MPIPSDTNELATPTNEELLERIEALEKGYTSMFRGPTIDAILSRAREGGTIDIKISSMRQDAVGAVESATEAATEAAKAEIADAAKAQVDAASASASQAARSATNAASSAQTAVQSAQSAAQSAQTAAQSVLNDYGSVKEQVQTHETRLDDHTENLHTLEIEKDALKILTERGQGNLQGQIQSVRADLSDAEQALADTGESVQILQAALTESGVTDLSTETGDTLSTEAGASLQGPALLVKTDRSLTLDGVPADAKATGDAIDARVEKMRAGIATAISALARESTAHDGRLSALSGRLDSQETAFSVQAGQLDALETGVSELTEAVTETVDVSLEIQSGDVIQAQDGTALFVPVRAVKTDSTLTRTHVPADAEVVGKSIAEMETAIDDASKSARNYADGLMYDYNDRLTQRFGNGAVTTLPVLNLWGSTAGMSKSVKKTLSYAWQGKSGTCECKWQGSSSINFPEKNYTVSFDRDFKLNDKWPAYHKWCFKSNWLDCTQSRGISCARIWSSLVKTWADAYTNGDLTDERGNTLTTEAGSTLQYPAYTYPIKYAPCYGATDGFPCVVEINGEFTGIYTCQIPKDEYMFGMTGTAGEAVVNSASYGFQVRLTEENFSSYLDIECATDDMTMSVIIESLNSLYDLLHGSTDGMMNALAERMNLTCTIDYMLFSALLLNWDGISRNWNLYTFDGGQHWNFSAYDLDNTCGNGYHYPYFFTMPGSWKTGNFAGNNPPLKNVTGNYLFNRIYTLNKPAIVNRYNSISQNILTPNQIYYNHVDFMKDIPYLLYLMDFKRWPTKPGTSMQTPGTIGAHVMMQAAALEREIAALK